MHFILIAFGKKKGFSIGIRVPRVYFLNSNRRTWCPGVHTQTHISTHIHAHTHSDRTEHAPVERATGETEGGGKAGESEIGERAGSQ